ncbi:MAG: hypothetical protein J7480_10190, partial [Microbacteriaceae bacterium]|nr:hypothetical protein [Microbacteriaceae bacterium]
MRAAAPMHPVLRAVVNALITLAVVLAVWQIVVLLASPYVAKGPVQVWNHLFVDEDAAAFGDIQAGRARQCIVGREADGDDDLVRF